MQDIDIICHHVDLPSVVESINETIKSHQNNINITLNLLTAANKCKIKRFVNASSSCVYGDDRNFDKIEDRLGYVLSPYALQKRVCELYAKLNSEIYQMECIGLRYFNVY